MKISRRILEYLNPKIKSLTTEVISGILESLGLEVERIEVKHPVSENKNLVFGLITSLEKVKDSKKLSLCKVKLLEGNGEDYKKDQVVQIVCGGNNLVLNTFVIVALPGQTIKGMEIQKRKVFNNESEGMICSFDELGITPGPFHCTNGILRFSRNNNESIPFLNITQNNKAREFLNDTIFHCETVQNSNYLRSIILLSKMIETFHALKTNKGKILDSFSDHLMNAKKNLSLNTRNVTKSVLKIDKELKEHVEGNIFSTKASNVIDTYKLVPKKIFVSLSYVGVNLVNEYVDYFSLLTHLTGQPLHIYDALKIDSINVLALRKEKKITTFGEKEKVFPKNTVVATNKERIISIPFIIGVSDFSVTNNVEKIFIEVLKIDEKLIRNTLKKVTVDSLSSNIGGKTISNFSFYSAIGLLHDIGFSKKRSISLNKNWVTRNLGLGNLSDEIEANYKNLFTLLQKFDIDIQKNETTLTFGIPFWLGNLLVEDDFIQFCYLLLDLSSFYKKEETLKKYLNSKQDSIYDKLLWDGFSHVETYTLTNQMIHDLFKIGDISSFNVKDIKLRNEMSNKYQVITSSLIGSMVSSLEINARYQKQEIKLFSKKTLPEVNNDFSLRLGILHAFKNVDDFKNNYNNLLETINKIIFLEKGEKFNLEVARENNFSNQSNTRNILVNNKVVGIIGEIKPSIISSFQFKGYTLFSEINLSKISSRNKNSIKFNRLSQVPYLSKDLTFKMKRNFDATRVSNLILQNDLVEKCNIIDFFIEGEDISVTYELSIFQIKPLTDIQLNELLVILKKKVEDVFKMNGVILKGSI